MRLASAEMRLHSIKGNRRGGPALAKVPRAGTKDLAKLLAEVNKIGSNINQIARALNRGRDFEKEFAQTLVERIRELQDRVRDELDGG